MSLRTDDGGIYFIMLQCKFIEIPLPLPCSGIPLLGKGGKKPPSLVARVVDVFDYFFALGTSFSLPPM